MKKKKKKEYNQKPKKTQKKQPKSSGSETSGFDPFPKTTYVFYKPARLLEDVKQTNLLSLGYIS